ncbi:DUF2111 domain-containing protein [Methanoregula sp. PtaB.Bin085]|uniref:DUF2111 domain-containing protein n=1 Tax=Methanoregula sp. PtaB.Bin085 TaxID=1811680 RepID=UPI0009D4AD18|nr:DUF2111 domain-containing protein [Methanoregula sp. PtaB.Bin085]OPX65468.1 MAG: hypothetical protein A4E33_00142 [Methanoregula sp. PtaB.Bin085]
MHRYTLSCSAEAADFEPVALAVHELVHRLPVTAKSRDKNGIRIEEGRVIDRNYSGPVLLDAIAQNRTIKVTPASGAYKGVPVTVSPVRDKDGDAIGAIGIVDITGIFDLATLMEHQSAILKQVCGKDPCPLPGEQIDSKR